MKLHGCHNTKRVSAYAVPVREWVLGEVFWYELRMKTQMVTDVTSKECQYRKDTPNDPRCEGCRK